MNRKEIKKALSERSWLSQDAVSRILNSLIELITDELTFGKDFNIYWLGKFKVVDRKSRNWVNPSTGDKIVIPASKWINFKPAAPFKDAIKNS